MIKYLFARILLVVLVGCTSGAKVEPATVTHPYATSNAALINPERGLYASYELPDPVGFSAVRILRKSLVHVNVRLDDWRESDLPPDLLERLDQNFADMRDGGIKAVIRFTYNAGPYPDSEPDASKVQVLRHIDQLAPLLQENADVIAWMEAGFIGAWGEWHTSTNELDTFDNKRDILAAILQALPTSRMVQIRYPSDIIRMYPTPLSAEDAFNGSDQARTAHHNDCFLASDDDWGTYLRDGANTRASDQAYLAALTRFTPMSGETCNPNLPRSSCESALEEMALLHVSALNESYHRQVIQSWDEGGCLDEIGNQLGYRFVLLSSTFNEQVRPGGIVNLSVTLTNSGMAAPINERPLYIVLNGDSHFAVRVEAIDPRRWEAGQTHTFAVRLRVPSEAAGVYQLALWLPDAADTLRDDPRYAIRFANEGIWDEPTGLNLLGQVTVNPKATGSVDESDRLMVIDAAIEPAPFNDEQD